MLYKADYDENGKKVLCEMNGVNSEMLMDIYVKKLSKGEKLEIFESENECAVLLLSGSINFTVGDSINEDCKRANPFQKTPYAVHFPKETRQAIDGFVKLGADKMPVCIAKTQYSLSDNPKLLGRPEGFKITITSANLSNGAGFLVCQAGNIMTLPGLSKAPAAYNIDIDENGNTVGLF